VADPYESPEDETPIQRRQRLMNLTNPAWAPAPAEEATSPAEMNPLPQPPEK